MEITALHTAVVEGNYDWTFVRIDTDADGLSRLGECYTAPGRTGIVRDLAPLLVGEDPRDVDRLWSKLRWGGLGRGFAGRHRLQRDLRDGGGALGPRGRAYGVPIHSLLGGRFRDSVRMYADCHAGDALESMDATMVARPARWARSRPRR
jgi:L-alanine-DL-glutamate epimerase-like enolase superfamily enzyme